MSNALADTRTGELTAYVPLAGSGLTREQVELLKTTICKDATDDELKLFITVCNLRGLNPFTGQIHFIKRRQYNARLNNGKGGYEEVATFQTGIDGYRLIAERTHLYLGQTKPAWCGKDGAWRDIWLEDSPPAAATVGVWKQGCTEPFYGIARWKAYVQTKQDGSPVRMWQQMDAEQLLKCAEALALRKAFPQELGGLYTSDEMAQAAVDQGPAGDGAPSRTPSPADFRDAQTEGPAQRRRAETGSAAGGASLPPVAAQTSGAGEREPASHMDGEVAGDVRDDPAPDSVPPQPGADFPRAGGAATARVRDLADELHVHIATALKLLSALPGGPVTSATVLSGDALAAARKALTAGGDGP